MSSSFTFIMLNLLYLLFFGFDVLFISNFKNSESLTSFTFLQRLGQVILMPGYIYLIFLWKKIIIMKKNHMNLEINNLLQKHIMNYLPMLFVASIVYSLLVFIAQDFVYNFNFKFITIISVFLRSSIEIVFWGSSFFMITMGVNVKFKIFILFFALFYFLSKFFLISQSYQAYILIQSSIIFIVLYTTLILYKFDYDRH